MNIWVAAYVLVGVGGLFFGQIATDLLALGIRQEAVNIIEKAIGAAVIVIGTLALASGITLPTLPKKESPPEG